MNKIAFVKGEDREANILACLRLLEKELSFDLKNKKSILIKPNCVNAHRPQGSTNIEALRAVLKFVAAKTAGEIIIGEGSGVGETFRAFSNLGYLDLKKDFPRIKFVDLNKDKFETVEVFDQNLKPFTQRIAKTVINADYRISLALPKTHDSVIVTLSLKNLVVGSLLDKCQYGIEKTIHQGYPAINRSLAKLAKIIPPHLSIIDGFYGMEGAGPSGGNLVEWHIALASKNWLALDCFVASLMDFNPQKIGYLYFSCQERQEECDPKNWQIIGNADPVKEKKHFLPHPDYLEQLKWQPPAF